MCCNVVSEDDDDEEGGAGTDDSGDGVSVEESSEQEVDVGGLGATELDTERVGR
jgi:hypothetical protein